MATPDLDGDGRTDAVFAVRDASGAYQRRLLMNTGTGFVELEPSQWPSLPADFTLARYASFLLGSVSDVPTFTSPSLLEPDLALVHDEEVRAHRHVPPGQRPGIARIGLRKVGGKLHALGSHE